ncbi:sensor histidine kinase [Acidimangrovimonas pyrenivorans]|uniref:histidine kinase n=1 Tax=Acidimangrovimonas pyrenivorans TaxID=2030798 RepID=A0ABV7AEV4_9RHOB
MNSDLLKSLLAGVPLPLVLIARDERIMAANAAARAIYGAGIEGRHYITVMRQPVLLDAIEGTMRHRQPSQARLSVSGAGGRETTWKVLAAPVSGEGADGVLVSFEDTTDLEQAGQMRRDFVANVSHELRTPLTALLGFIETLKGAARDDNAARDRFLGIMEREAGRMNRLVSDLLSLSRVEAEERVRPVERIDILALLGASVAALRPMAAEAGVTIEMTGEAADPEATILVQADPDQMTQVFNNLIENAVKYGGAGKQVTVDVSRQARDASLRAPAVRIDVIDRGEGIDAIHIPRLTERFYRVDSHRSREKGGTGLGLAIVKHIVNRHRGRFRIESEKGEGSKFSVLLPES